MEPLYPRTIPEAANRQERRHPPKPYQSPVTRRFVKVQEDHRAGRTTIVAEKEVAI